jgi:hypothetical protein
MTIAFAETGLTALEEGALAFAMAADLGGVEALAEAEEKGRKKEFEDAIVEAGAHLAELVASGRPPPDKGEEHSSASVRASVGLKPGNCYASVSYSCRTESEKAKQMLENVRGLFPKAKRQVELDRKAGGGVQHWQFRQGNALVAFHFTPGRPKGSYGAQVYVRAQTPQRAKAYLSTLLGKLPGWAKQIYHNSLTAKRETTEAQEGLELV